MKRIQVFIWTLFCVFNSTTAQNFRNSVEPEWEEIKNSSQLIQLEKKVVKGEKLLRLDIEFDLKEKDFAPLTHVLQLSPPKELVVHFKDKPTDELLKQVKDLSVLEISFKDPAMAICLEKIDWTDIEYVSLTANNIDDFKTIPFSQITCRYIEIYKQDGEDMKSFELSKNDESKNILISKNLIETDSTTIVNLLLSNGEIVSTEDTDWKPAETVHIQTARNEHKIDFLQNQTVPMDSWTVHTAESFYLNTTGGALVYIPEQAFVTSTGKTYKGFVDITFQQWNSREELINSNIPLHEIKNNGDTVFYITNGMFDIRAYDENNQPLSLAENKSIGIQVPVNLPTDNFNLYAFNEKTSQWDERGTVAQNKTEVFNNLSSTTINQDSLKKNLLDSLLNNLVYNFDTTRFRIRYDDPGYVNLIDYKRIKGKIPTYYRGLTNQKYVRTKTTVNGARNMVRPILKRFKINDTTSYYSISFSDRFYARYPEVRLVFGGRMFIPTDVKRKEWRADYYKYKKYNDFRFVYNGGPFVTLQLKHAEGYHDVNIQTFNPKVKSKRSGKTVNKMVKKYNKYLKRRENIYNVMIAEKISRFILQQKTRLEGNMRSNGPPIMYASLNLLTLGLTNIDHPYYDMPKKTLVSPSYIADGQKLPLNQVEHVQIMDQATFGIFQFKGGSFIYSKVNVQQMILTDKAGNQYVATEESIDKLKDYVAGTVKVDLVPFADNRDKILQLEYNKKNE